MVNINQEKKPLKCKGLNRTSLALKFVCLFAFLFDALAIQININTNGFVSIVPSES